MWKLESIDTVYGSVSVFPPLFLKLGLRQQSEREREREDGCIGLSALFRSALFGESETKCRESKAKGDVSKPIFLLKKNLAFVKMRNFLRYNVQ